MDDRLESKMPPNGPAPDIMNDPQYATNTADGGDSIGDPDTCRICRGEGSDQEPLFHPCKCSGSIKYVHQGCLMEWLSHSQKKHCELCKTPFRFTKLYSPNMPQSLPILVLLRHVVIHSVRNVATWLRFCLVVTVWLGCLPYTIRQVWRLLFWFSDGGWPSKYLTIDTTRNSTAIQALEMARELQLASLTGNGTSPVTPLHASQTTPASIGGMMDKLMGFLMPFSQTLNISGSDPLAAGLFKSLYYGFGIQSVVIPEGQINNTSATQFLMTLSPASRTPSLLSDVPFLRNLTRHTYVNQLVITIAEGYIITILVVVCFILVFLIREWVVQQQPGINMGAGFNAGLAIVERPRDEQVQAEVEARRAANENFVDNPLEPREIGQRPMARPRRRNVQFEATNELPLPAFDQEREQTRLQRQHTVAQDPAESSNQTRPAPVRDVLSPAVEIQRRLTEEPRMTEEFLAIWRRSEGDPREVLRIIEKENRGDQMRYWVNAMKILQNPLPQTGNREQRMPFPGIPTSPDPRDRLPALEDIVPGPTTSTVDSNCRQTESDRSSASSESWVDVPKALHIRKQPIFEVAKEPNSENAEDCEKQPLDKGKGKAKEDPSEPLFDPAIDLLPGIGLPKWNAQPGSPWRVPAIEAPSFPSSSARPRAISDGPQPRETKSPLANNNWTFSNLPEDEDENNKKFSWVSENTRPVESQPESQPDDEASKSNVPESSSQGSQAWKAAQDLRVQQAVVKGREAHKSALGHHVPAVATLPSPSEFDGPIQIQGQDGVIRDAQNWDEVFANNPVPESDDDDETDEHHEGREPNPFHPETPPPEVREPIVVQPAEPQGIMDHVADWLWGGVGDERRQDEQGGNDEHIVEDLAAEAPFVPVAHRDLFDQGGDGLAGQDPEVVEAAIAAGLDPNDPDEIDDAEDFEGIMELVGMRGPLFSLVQNALFSAFLLALTVAFGVWIPYNIGRVSLLLIANPGPAFKLPLRLAFGFAALLQDLALSVIGLVSYCVIAMFSSPLNILSFYASQSDADKGIGWSLAALQLSANAIERIMDGTVGSLIHITDSEIFAFSAASHESLITIKALITDTLGGIGSSVVYLFVGDYELSPAGTWIAVNPLLEAGMHQLAGLPAFLARPDSWVISLEVAKRSNPLNLELSVWDGMDRFWATLAGYTALSLLGALYVRKGSPFSSGPVGREWEATIIDLLNQAGGVMKVILIISIEMLVFPLYCGLLLDAALLPLFDNATITSRILFTFKSPVTSIFVHWFVGTCYMFHFALFVSMCRKIMRKGVLYFIRDPDDPTFHPVRDVLERNVATQLRKILFSALVYGALVVICLGGVVWGLAFAFRGVLPIHWSSNEPVLEFPIDLLFYNFLMPLAVRFFKPSDGLHAMYSWWFRRCARMLRLTWFMFDERKVDEEGYNVRRSWGDVFKRIKGDPLNKVKIENTDGPFEENPKLIAYFRQDGRYVRAPASDQVRIPKGTKIFLEVDEMNNRIDGVWDRLDGVHGRDSDLYKQVYVPPWFRVRICLFILFIWLFAALTGVCITIVPLVFGRQIFAKVIPTHVRKNDVYAFSIGIYILGSALYALLRLRKFITYIHAALAINAETPQTVLRHVTSIASRIARIAWTYTAFLFILPTLFAFLIEFYFIVPLHTYFAVEEHHVVHFVQSWTLGLLYVKLTTRIILCHEESRPAQSLRAITRNGYLNPDARLATRSFILPVGLVLCTALFYPWCLARIAVLTLLKDSPDTHFLAYRYAYPMTLCVMLIGFAMWCLLDMVKGWRMSVRDEVYLIGERLHNFGDRKSEGVSVPSVRRIET